MSAATGRPSCAELLKVLADETRLAVVEALLSGPLRVFELNEKIDVEQSLLSHHLKVLRHAGIVESERDGKAVLYSLSSALASRRLASRGKGQGIDLGCCQLVFPRGIFLQDRNDG